MLRVGLYTILTIFLFLFLSSKIYASGALVPTESINPGSTAYFLKRIIEKGWGMLLFNDSAKYNYNRDLLNKRVSELDYVTKNNSIGEIEKTSQRVSFYAGEYASITKKLNDKEYSQQAKKEMLDYKNYLGELRDRFPANSGEWLFVQQSIDSISMVSNFE